MAGMGDIDRAASTVAAGRCAPKYSPVNPEQTPQYLASKPGFPARLLLFTLLVGAFLAYLNDTLLNVGLASIMADFQIGKTTAQWLVTGFLLVMGALTPLTANLIQWLDTRRMVLLTQGIFLLGSLICTLAPSFAVLLAGRLFQAVAAAFFVPLLFNGVLSIFAPGQRGAAMGLIAMMFTVAPAIGPTLSGLVVDHLGWRYLFALMIPCMLASMLLVARCLTVNLSEITRPPVDGPSALASVLGFGGLVFASSSFNDLPPWLLAAILLAAAGMVAFFVRRQWRLATPLLNVRVFALPQFRHAVLILACAYFIFMGMELMVPLYAQQVLLLSGTATGLALLPASVVQAAAAPLLGTLLDRRGGRFVLIPATLALLAALALMWAMLGLHTPAPLLAALFALMALAATGCITGETHGLNALPHALNPHGASIIATLTPIAGALGAAFFVGVTTAGESLNASTPAAMLGGVRLSMACALAVALLAVLTALRIQPQAANSAPA